MTEGPEEGPGFFMLDPEAIRQMHERQQMTVETISHAIEGMVEWLSTDKDQLLAFKWLMAQIGSYDNTKLAVRFEGVAATYLKIKYDVCGNCGVNHSEMEVTPEEQAKAAADVKASAKSQDDLNDVLGIDTAVMSEDYLTPEQVIEHILKNDNLDAAWIIEHVVKMKMHPPLPGMETDMMKLYNLDDLWFVSGDKDIPDEFRGFVCVNCGMQYGSIQDRMLVGVDECKGCYLKAAHG